MDSSTNSSAIVEEDSGTHYQTAYTYFYVPGVSVDPELSTDDTDMGAILRLGEYSDLEETAYGNGSQVYSTYFPTQHIVDESGDTIYKNASGGGKGILMACDGRLLIRTGEKLYIGATGALNIKSDESEITIQSGTSSSGTDQDINLIAGSNGQGALNTTVYKDVKTVNGEQYEVVTSASHKLYKADIVQIIEADYIKHIKGNTYTLHQGSHMHIFKGDRINLKLAAETNFNVSGALTLTTAGAVVFYALGTAIGLIKTDIVAYKTEIEDGSLKVLGATFQSTAVAAETKNIVATQTPVATFTRGVSAEQIAAETKNVNVKALIGMWESKIASTVQI